MPVAKEDGAKKGGKKPKKLTKKQLQKLEEARLQEEMMQRLLVMKADYKDKCFFYITDPKDQIIKQVERAVAAKEGLKKLVLSKQRTSQNDARAIADTLKNNPDIQTTHLWHVKVDTKAAAIYSDFLITLPALTYVELVDSNVNDEAAAQLARFCRQSKTVQTLVLDHNPLTEKGIGVLFDGLRENKDTKLASFSARYCEAGSECGVNIARFLRANNSITSIDLAHNNLGDTGVLPIAYALQFNRSLKSLCLANNVIIGGPPFAPPSLETTTTNAAVSSTDAGVYRWTIPGVVIADGRTELDRRSTSFATTDGPSAANTASHDANGELKVLSAASPAAVNLLPPHSSVAKAASTTSLSPANATANPETNTSPLSSHQSLLRGSSPLPLSSSSPSATPPDLVVTTEPLCFLADVLVNNNVIYLVDLRGNHIGAKVTESLLAAVKARAKSLAIWVSERTPEPLFLAIQDGNRKVFEVVKKGKGKKKGKK